MPIRPQPYTLLCNKCGWQQSFWPKSDCIPERLMPEACPRCKNKPLLQRAANFKERLLLKLRYTNNNR